jgi:hypothetical protein
MKKKINILAVALFFSLLPIALFTSCDKDTNSYVDVLVLDEATRNPVSGVEVILYQPNGGETTDTGFTSTDGIYSTYFPSPAILSIKVSKAVENNGLRKGNGTVRLIEGEKVTAEVNLASEIFY